MAISGKIQANLFWIIVQVATVATMQLLMMIYLRMALLAVGHRLFGLLTAPLVVSAVSKSTSMVSKQILILPIMGIHQV
jgi:hypothetical protein